MPKNKNNNRPNIQERHHHNQNHHHQSLQMLNQNFLIHPKNAMQKGAKNEARHGPPLSEKATGYAPSPIARTSTGPNGITVTFKPPLQTPLAQPLDVPQEGHIYQRSKKDHTC
jgi:hypothetical protein